MPAAAVHVTALLCAVVHVFGENVIVSTALGDVMGAQRADHVEFKGIPYTEYAPIGEYRFQEAVLRTSPFSQDVYDATFHRASCIQFFTVSDPTDSEDCLHLNIQSANIDVNGSVSGDLLPVMVWIHGGAFLTGTGSLYDGTAFLPKTVFVSINYRLASLGFLALDSLLNATNGKSTGGMNGIYDQIVALQWIQQFIEDFGGDPARVTIFGESAGGFSVCYLSVLPLAAGLFDQAIIQSGHCSPPWATQQSKDASIASSLAYLNAAGLSDSLDELRALNSSFFTTWFVNPWPSVDGYLLQTTTHEMLVTGDYSLNPDRVVIGSTSLDSLAVYPWSYSFNPLSRLPVSDYEFEALLAQYIGDDANSIELLVNTYYPLSEFAASAYDGVTYSDQQMRGGVVNADVCFKCFGIFYLQQIMQNPNSLVTADDVFLYNFKGPEPPYYMTHGSDVVYLFWNATTSRDFRGVPAEFLGVPASKELSDFMIDAWTNFGVYGVPNSSLNDAQWTPFGIDESAMVFGPAGTNIAQFATTGYRNGVCDFWINTVGLDAMASLCREDYTLSPTAFPSLSPTQAPSMDESAASMLACLYMSVVAILFFAWML